MYCIRLVKFSASSEYGRAAKWCPIREQFQYGLFLFLILVFRLEQGQFTFVSVDEVTCT
jgi:hypothetical protein